MGAQVLSVKGRFAKEERGAIYDVAKSPLYRYTDEKFGHLRVAKKKCFEHFFV